MWRRRVAQASRLPGQPGRLRYRTTSALSRLRQASVSLVDYFESAGADDETFAVAVSDLVVGEASKIQYTAVQEWNSKSRHFQLNSTRVGRDGNASRCVVIARVFVMLSLFGTLSVVPEKVFHHYSKKASR